MQSMQLTDLNAQQQQQQPSVAVVPVPQNVLPQHPVLVNPNPRGCWTCRIRRKKCDEQEDSEGKCSTCRRLKLNCLGWSPRRPEWMRDKAAVEEYKRKIKQQLMDQGMVRGQPKAGSTHGMHPYIVPGHMPVWSQHQSGGGAGGGGGLNRANSARSSSTDDEFSSGQSSSNASDQYSPVYYQQGLQQQTDAVFGYPSDGFIFESMGPQTQDQQHQFAHASANNMLGTFDASVLQSFPVMYQTQPYEPAAQQAQAIERIEQIPRVSMGMQSSLGPVREQQVLYYFQHVRGFQYVFAGKDLTATFCDLITDDPHGAVTSAICSLSSVHNSRLRLAHGLSAYASTDSTPHNRFYEDAIWRINQAKQATGAYSQTDATAAVHAISYWLFQGGSGQWEAVLNVAREWLTQTPMYRDENPVLPLIRQDDKVQFASRATMWMDIFSSVSTMRAPRFLEMYRRLFRGVEGYWSSAVGIEHNKLRMDGLMGCPDEVMLTIAEAANLASWAERKRKEGTLSVRELVARADAIERELRTQEALRAFEASSSRTDYNEFDRLLREPLPDQDTAPYASSACSSSASSVPSPSSAFAAPLPASIPGSNHASPMLPVPSLSPPLPPQRTQDEEMRAQVSKVFREAAILYLYTVMSGSYPKVREIVDAVSSIIESLKILPASQYDRSLVFPICLAGCMTDDPAHRNFLRNRLLEQDASVGNVGEARLLMEAVWQRRDTMKTNPHWLDVMQDLGINLLLV